MKRLSPGTLIALCFACVTPPVAAQAVYEGDGEPLPVEEEIRWLLNRARFDRARENARRGTSYTDIPARSGPLAPNASLIRSARRHSEDLARTNRFQHETVPNSLYYNHVTQKKPWDRMSAEGYNWNLAGENIAAGYTSGVSVYVGWWVSGGHRRNMGNEGFREIGNGYFFRAASEYRDYYGMNLGRSGSARFFTDTLFNDANGNSAYNQGEGRPGIRVLLLTQGALHPHCDVSTVTGSFAVPLQGIPHDAVVTVVLENTTAQSVSLHLPRNASTLDPLVLGPSESRAWGRFVNGTGNAGFRDLDPVPYFLTATPGTRQHESDGTASAAVSITSSSPWNAVSNAAWLRVIAGAEGQEEGTLTYAVDPNDFGDPRSAALLFTNENHVVSTFTVTQNGVPAELQVAEDLDTMPASGQPAINLAVTANVTWNAASTAHWIELTNAQGVGNGALLFDVAPNAGSLPRETTITVNGGGLTREILIRQEASAAPTVAQQVVLDPSEGVGTVRKVTSLPPGMVWDKTSGRLRGQPTRAGTYTIRVEVRAADGSLSRRSLTLVVEELPAHAVGVFEARIQQVAGVAGGLGGEVRFTTTKSGVLTGVLRMSGQTSTFRQRLVFNETEGPLWTRDIQLPGQSSPLRIRVLLGEDQRCEGTAKVGEHEAEIHGWRLVWKASEQPLPQSRQGRFHVLGEVTEPWRGDELVPQGFACAVLTTSESGRSVWTGKLGDGTAITRSGWIGPEGDSGFWLPAYRGTGSVVWQGALDDDRSFAGAAAWIKGGAQPSKTRAYRQGFGRDDRGLVILGLEGEAWTAPATGQSLANMMGLLGLPFEWSLTFTDGVMSDTASTPLDRLLGLGHDNRFTLPAPGQPGNENRLRLRVNARTGWLHGGFDLVDDAPDKPGSDLRRPVVLHGLLLPASRLAGGFFIANKRPDPHGTPPRTRANSDRLTGAMLLQVIETW